MFNFLERLFFEKEQQRATPEAVSDCIDQMILRFEYDAKSFRLAAAQMEERATDADNKAEALRIVRSVTL